MRLLAADFGALEATLHTRREQVDATLRTLVAPGQAPPVQAALEDSLFAPGKRLRPILALLVAEILRGDPESVLPAACAIEMVHTASLILDDLPCMDDAALRRGRPTCHVAHGEATAILAAFALQNRAFEILGHGWPGAPDASVRSGLARDLARAIGLSGMIAGQSKDLEMTDRPLDFQTLEFIHSRKTGALFIASAELGAAAARAAPAERAAVGSYAKNLGLAFQIMDDLIDAVGAPSEAGKDVGQDLKKTTFVSFSGVDGARQLAEELIVASVDALAGFGAKAQP
ncbi:MAG TPA: polyprenyl synthetase family protein, partial [Vicinamibacteria bacterium]